jgi:hypothetical protein
MSGNDPLRAVLREWQAPEPSAALDERVRAGFRAARAPSLWAQFLTARITVPVPVLAAAMVLLALAWYIGFRPASPAAPARRPGVVTRLEATGFQPVPNGPALIEDVRQ